MSNLRHLSRCVLLTAIFVRVSLPLYAAEAPPSEQALIEVLRSGSPAEKAITCKKLAIYGNKDAVPELAKLLTDEQLASWARIALEAIPDPAADEALLKSCESLKGKLLVGAINSIGVRGSAGAVDQLAGRLKDQDADVASAAAVALGRIGSDTATKSLRQSLAGAAPPVRSAVAEGCILCAERLIAEGKTDQAAEVYDEVRRAELPKQRIIEATRGAILARKAAGIPLLIEQLKSSDKGFVQLGLSTARELPGREVADALVAEVPRTNPERAALLLYALADREDAAISPALLETAKKGDKQVRIAAVNVIGRLGDISTLPPLLEIAAEGDEELAQAAITAAGGLPGKQVDQAIIARLPQANGKSLAVLIELIGERRIDATDTVMKALDHSDAAVRHAALTALGETVGPKQLSALIALAFNPKNPDDAKVAAQALRAACVRMPDRDACAAELAAAMPDANAAMKVNVVEILGAMGGAKALETIASTMKSGNEELQEAGSRMLGDWMSVDAGPVLLDLAKTASSDKYQLRALRGYIRLVRQFAMPNEQRAAMCQNALEASTRPDEQKLVLTVLERYPSVDTLKVAINAIQVPALKDDAMRSVCVVGQKLAGKSDEAQQLLAKIGLGPAKIEIVKAEYGAGATQKDVTAVLQKQVHDSPLVTLPAPSYDDSFGDPLPGTIKQLKVQYRIDGKPAEATFAENAAIILPMPK
jgi:HEAT repeat protein